MNVFVILAYVLIPAFLLQRGSKQTNHHPIYNLVLMHLSLSLCKLDVTHRQDSSSQSPIIPSVPQGNREEREGGLMGTVVPPLAHGGSSGEWPPKFSIMGGLPLRHCAHPPPPLLPPQQPTKTLQTSTDCPPDRFTT